MSLPTLMSTPFQIPVTFRDEPVPDSPEERMALDMDSIRFFKHVKIPQRYYQWSWSDLSHWLSHSWKSISCSTFSTTFFAIMELIVELCSVLVSRGNWVLPSPAFRDLEHLLSSGISYIIAQTFAESDFLDLDHLFLRVFQLLLPYCLNEWNPQIISECSPHHLQYVLQRTKVYKMFSIYLCSKRRRKSSQLLMKIWTILALLHAKSQGEWKMYIVNPDVQQMFAISNLPIFSEFVNFCHLYLQGSSSSQRY